MVVSLSLLFATLKFLIWCRRGDSNPHELPHTPLKRARPPVPPLRHEVSLEGSAIIAGKNSIKEPRHCYETRSYNEPHYLLAAGEAAGAAGEACCAGAGVGVAVGAGAGALSDSRTDREPLSIGRPSVSAINMNAAAAPIVIFARRLAVPRGPKAVLDNVFEKSAPASALPG